MGQLFEFISENMFLAILIISGIIGIFSSNKEQQKKQQEQKQRQDPVKEKPVATPSRPRPSVQKRQTRSEMEMKPDLADVMDGRGSIESEQQAQMKRLEAKYGGTSSSTIFESDIANHGLQLRQALEQRNELTEEQELLKKDIRNNLRNKGLINGIIMAEVLGKPRSLKPYQNVSMERYKR